MATRSNTKTKKKSGFGVLILFVLIFLCIFFAGKHKNNDNLENSNSATSLDSTENSDNKDSAPNFDQTAAYEVKNKFNSKQISLNDAIYTLAQDDSRVSEVYNNMDNYSEAVLKLLVENPEARNFVLDYPQHLNDEGKGKLSKDEKNGGIPHFLQWDKRWGYFEYGSSVLGITGCGPTCLSMIIVGLLNDYDATPSAVAKFSEDNGYYIEGAGSSWDLMENGATSYGLSSQEVPLAEGSMIAELQAGHPLVINVCPGDFTAVGHFMVITDYQDGLFTINDPNSNRISNQGWDYQTLARQIMNIWSFSVA